jgi:hypothetical protein
MHSVLCSSVSGAKDNAALNKKAAPFDNGAASLMGFRKAGDNKTYVLISVFFHRHNVIMSTREF